MRRRDSISSRALACLMCGLLIGSAIPRTAFAVETVEPADTPTFNENTPAALQPLDTDGKLTAAKARTTPVSASGTFSHAVALQMPPGRRGMTPSLSIAYDSGSTAESAVGAGMAFGVGRISRSTRAGFPKVKNGPFHHEYAADTTFTGPDGEMVPASDGPPTSGAQSVFAPRREQSAVRYTYDPAGFGSWVEHLPSGVKRYYGKDPFTNTIGVVLLELGTASWLLLREEDPYGNDITYEYHNVDQDPVGAGISGRSSVRRPVLKRVRWGGNRKTGLKPAFRLTTKVSDYSALWSAGPVDVLDGTELDDKIDRIEIGPDEGTPWWTYKLAFEKSPDSGKLRLRQVARIPQDTWAESITFTTFGYSESGPKWSAKKALPAGLADIYSEGVSWKTRGSPFSPRQKSMERAFNPPGARAGLKFVDLDGNGATDAIYHAAGIRTTASQPVWSLSAVQSNPSSSGTSWVAPSYPTLLPPFESNYAAPAGLLTELVDLEGDGDTDGLSFPVRFTMRTAQDDKFNLPAPTNRSFMSFSHCTSRAFWDQECPGVEPLPPWTDDSRASLCERKVSACFTPPYEAGPLAAGEMLVRAYTNVAKAGGVRTQPIQVLEDWPAGVEQVLRVSVDAVEPGMSLHVGREYTPTTESDFFAPSADINADGKKDLVLFKHRQRWVPNRRAVVAIDESVIAKLVEGGQLRVSGKEAGSLRKTIETGIGNELYPLIVSEGLLLKAWLDKVPPSKWIVYEGTAGDLGLDGIPSGQQAQIIGVPPGEPIPAPPGGPIGPDNPFGGPISPPEDVSGLPPLHDDWCGTIGRIIDLPIFKLLPRGADGGLLLDATRFVPRAYLAVGPERHFVPDSAASARPEAPESGFSQSLADILNNGKRNECISDDCKFPPHVQWNTLLLDVNSDGLPDLVAADPPWAKNTCSDGHTVYLNRGFKWEKVGSNVRWDAAGVPAEEQALAVIANRGASCNGRNNIFGGVYQEQGIAKFPLASMAPIDLNADGRVDLVLSFKRTDYEGSEYGLTQRVFLNNGRAFVPAEKAATNYDTKEILPPVAQAMELTAFPQTQTSTFPSANWPDTARFVDLDNDGLIDIAQPGRCKMKFIPGAPGDPEIPGLPGGLEESCMPGGWYRNEGTIPDLVTSVTSSTGAWTEVDYAPPFAPLVELPPEGLRPAATSRVVSTIRSAEGPRVVPAGYEPFPVQEVTFGYRNFVRDPESTEVLGYEEVVADFHNTYRGTAAGTVRVTRTFDVRPELVDASGAVLPVRFPLKGAPVSTVVEADGWKETDLSTFAVESLGSGVRIRPVRELHGTTSAVGVTAWSGSEMLDRDAYGNPTKIRSGTSDGTSIGPAAQVVAKTIAYENRPASWQIGLTARETSRGYSEDVSGTVNLARVLSDVETTYTAGGAVETSTRLGITAAGCSGAADDTTTYAYYPNGLVRLASEVGRRDVTTVYDASQLYPARSETKVSRAVGTQITPAATTLAISYETDIRTGSTTKVTDANGVTHQSLFDSRGRRLEFRAGGTLLEETFYSDAFPMFAQTRGHVDAGKFFDRRTDVDAAGSTLSVVEGRGTTAVPYIRKAKAILDAFGRVAESFQPEEVSALGDGWKAAQSGKTTTSYDGLDRVTSIVRPDSTTTKFDYEPRATTETDARGTATRRIFDAFGELVVVHRNPGGAAGETSSHFLVRDGAGQLVRVVDGDANVRQIERDGGGRVRVLTLPQKPGASGGQYILCHDLDDNLASLQSPAGRVSTAERDELGRVVRGKSIDAAGNALVTWQNYDDPTTPGGLGRLTAKSDASGVYGFSYDLLGYPKSVTFAPSARALAGAQNVSSSYTARFSYNQTGALTKVAFDGLPSAADLTYQHDDKGRPTWVDSSDGHLRQVLAGEFAYDVNDRVTNMRFGNSTYGEWHYNALSQRLDKIAYRDASRNVFSAVDYIYDANGNPREESRSKAGASGFYTQKIQAFDALDRLKSADVFAPSGNRRETFDYTPGGDLKTASDETYSYDSPVTPQAVSLVRGGAEGKRALSYDDDGHLSEETSERANGSSRKRSVRFDANGCLSEVAQYERFADGRDERSISSFVCGLDGRVVGRHSEGAEGTSTRIDFAGLAEIRPEEGIFLIRVPISGTTSVEDARSLTTGERITQASGYLHTDMRGSVLAMTEFDQSSILTREADYDAWGSTIATSGLATPRHAFINHEPVPGVGYYNFGARAYDPTLRRWLSPDPLLFLAPDVDAALGQELNLYQYAANNPARHIDPNGTAAAAAAAPAEGVAVVATPFIIWGGIAVGAVFVVQLVRTGSASEAADRTRQNVQNIVEKGRQLYNQVRSAEKTAETIKKVEENCDETAQEIEKAAEEKREAGRARVEQGKAGEAAQIAKEQQAGNVIIGEQIRVATSHGTRVLDVLASPDGTVKNAENVEVKTGSSPYTPQQRVKDNEIAQKGGVARGKAARKAGIEGQKVQVPTRVERLPAPAKPQSAAPPKPEAPKK